MKMRKEQFNTRVHPALKVAAQKTADECVFTRDEIAEVALALLFGSRDVLILAKREKITEAQKKLRLILPFEYPLTPTSHNARNNGIMPLDRNKVGAVAQLEERVNGIHEVVGSKPASSTKKAVAKHAALITIGGNGQGEPKGRTLSPSQCLLNCCE